MMIWPDLVHLPWWISASVETRPAQVEESDCLLCRQSVLTGGKWNYWNIEVDFVFPEMINSKSRDQTIHMAMTNTFRVCKNSPCFWKKDYKQHDYFSIYSQLRRLIFKDRFCFLKIK